MKENLHDIQDNVVAPILMRYGRHVFLKFTDGTNARAWLRNMFELVNARREEHGTRFTVNIGFTYEGLKALGLSQRSLDSFPEAFRVGMRGRADDVGDVGPHAPEHWEGGLGGPDIHAMAWIRTDSDQGREEATRIVRSEMDAIGGVEVRFVQDTMALAHATASGRRASISVLRIRSRSRRSKAPTRLPIPETERSQADGTWRALKPGEFLLGYEDEAGADGIQTPEPRELRLNGTYMVFRKLYQDVAAFRRYMLTAAKALYGSDDEHHQELVAAKMMGRWRSGCPVDLSPDKDDPAIAADPERRNNFSYAGDDAGLRCPLGSHLRRTNPRATPLKRATAVRRHRLIRRGVEYGPQLRERRARRRRRRSRPDQSVHPSRHRTAVRVRAARMDDGRRVHRARSERP